MHRQMASNSVIYFPGSGLVWQWYMEYIPLSVPLILGPPGYRYIYIYIGNICSTIGNLNHLKTSDCFNPCDHFWNLPAQFELLTLAWPKYILLLVSSSVVKHTCMCDHVKLEVARAKTYRVEKFIIITLCSPSHKNHFQARQLGHLQKVLATYELFTVLLASVACGLWLTVADSSWTEAGGCNS